MLDHRIRNPALLVCALVLLGCAAPSAGADVEAVVPPKSSPQRVLAQPWIPDDALGEKDQVVVGVDLLVKTNGRVGDARIVVSSGDPAIDGATLRTAMGWRLQSGRLNGKRTEMWSIFTVTFGKPGPPTPEVQRSLAEIQKLREQRRAELEARAKNAGDE